VAVKLAVCVRIVITFKWKNKANEIRAYEDRACGNLSLWVYVLVLGMVAALPPPFGKKES